ncbi:hypothetical protein R3P38DRAFT_2812354 [Favolaschia claudopus]|uniref:Transposase n=1 Tax=Favolaschia claudopus TaxID=2862362 RepID=A0AAV9Z7B5_9AGAR
MAEWQDSANSFSTEEIYGVATYALRLKDTGRGELKCARQRGGVTSRPSQAFPDEELKAPAWAPTNIQDPDKDEVVWALFKERVAGCDLSSSESLRRRFGLAHVLEQCDLGNTSAPGKFDQLAHWNLQNTRSSGEDLTAPSANWGNRDANLYLNYPVRLMSCRRMVEQRSACNWIKRKRSTWLIASSNLCALLLQIARGTRIIDQGLATQDLAQSTGSGTGLVSDSTPPKNSLRRSPNLCAALHYPNRLRRAEDSTSPVKIRRKLRNMPARFRRKRLVLHLLELLEGLEKDDIIHISCVIPTSGCAVAVLQQYPDSTGTDASPTTDPSDIKMMFKSCFGRKCGPIVELELRQVGQKWSKMAKIAKIKKKWPTFRAQYSDGQGVSDLWIGHTSTVAFWSRFPYVLTSKPTKSEESDSFGQLVTLPAPRYRDCCFKRNG